MRGGFDLCCSGVGLGMLEGNGVGLKVRVNSGEAVIMGSCR